MKYVIELIESVMFDQRIELVNSIYILVYFCCLLILLTPIETANRERVKQRRRCQLQRRQAESRERRAHRAERQHTVRAALPQPQPVPVSAAAACRTEHSTDGADSGLERRLPAAAPARRPLPLAWPVQRAPRAVP